MDVGVATSGPASAAFALQKLRLRPWLAAALAFLCLFAVFLLAFDWNWLRHPLERYISNKTQREFRAGHLDVALGMVPTIKLKDVYFANAPWSSNTEPTATIGALEFTVSLRDWWETKKIYIPHATLTEADLQLERAPDLKKNWVLKEPQRSAEPSRVRIGSITVGRGRLRYVNHANPFDVDIVARPAAESAASASDSRYTTRLAFRGRLRTAVFNGDVVTGDIISLRGTHLAFPIKGTLVSAANRLEIEGSMTDVVERTAAQVRFRIAGSSLDALRPALAVALPASPPYAFRGHLRKNAGHYLLEDLEGTIGASDFRGTGDYRNDEPHPRLKVVLASRHLNLIDWPAEKSAARAQKAPLQTSGGDPFSALDAEIRYTAAKVQWSRNLPAQDMVLVLALKDAVARLSPLDLGFAGGRILSEVVIDARNKQAVESTVKADVRRVQLSSLLPPKEGKARPVGAVGAQIRLKGTGTSVAELAASANGTIALAMDGGRISSAMDAAAGMNGGKLLSVLIGGDKGVNVNCAGAHFDVKNGIGQSRLMVVDTEQTRVDGGGAFNLKEEKFAFTLQPKPKKAGILSLRTPMYLYGTFSAPHFSFDRNQMALRAGGALVLALVNPIAALLPLVEAGSGTDLDCDKLLASVPGARQQTAVTGSGLPRRD
jgi:AsmA family protein